jgi:hypothetical protein
MLLCPDEVNISDINSVQSLSPRNFSTIDIPNKSKKKLLSFLDDKAPCHFGEEPGSFAYVSNSSIAFVRNSCIDQLNYSNQLSKEIYLNPKYGYENMLCDEDVLLCKDANIGDSCIFLCEKEKEYVISSGVVKLNFKNNIFKYYCLAFLQDEYFLHQLDALTPRGATIRHAGSKFLECFIPELNTEERKLVPLLEACLKNSAYAERISLTKLNAANTAIKNDFLEEDEEYELPSFSAVNKSLRLDGGYYSTVVNNINHSLNKYSNGTITLNDFGFILKRGPNLAKRDLGRSIKSNDYKKNYHLLVYPSDISDNGYILKEVYLGARNSVWYMKSGDILFSAEGTVGKVFVICDEKMKFITNFHGLIISPKNKKISLENSIILGQYLHFLRSYGYFDKVSVGGQGGSFAVNYWEGFRIPKFDAKLKKKVAMLYHSGAKLNPGTFCLTELDKAGVFELNHFRIKCQEVVKMIVKDIKNGIPNNRDYYLSSIA